MLSPSLKIVTSKHIYTYTVMLKRGPSFFAVLFPRVLYVSLLSRFDILSLYICIFFFFRLVLTA